MPASVGGKRMRGVVIPHAKPLGGSRAYDPHKPPHKRVHIDPHIEGQSVVVDLDQITPDIAEEAIDLGPGIRRQARRPGPRHRPDPAAECGRLPPDRCLAAGQWAVQPASRPRPVRARSSRSSRRCPAADDPVTAPPSAPALASGPRTIKAGQLRNGTPQPTHAQAKGGLLDAYQKPRPQPPVVAASSVPVSPPTKKVTFGVPGFGLHEAYYHDVIINNQQFILVYDERYRGGGKFLPQIDGPFAARVEGDPMDYQLLWPDQSFTDPATGRTYFQLLIEERVPQGGEP